MEKTQEIKTTTAAVIKSKLKYFPMSEDDTCIAKQPRVTYP